MAVLNSSSFTQDSPAIRATKGKLIKVELEPGRSVKMYEADAIARGLVKSRPAQQNKMMPPAENKAAVPEQPAAPAPTGDDFTTIPGIGKAAARAINAAGITTFEQLRTADLSFLAQRAQEAIEVWRAE
jgi:predicted flap endonuclease-1-like 5' DNA nuclease